MISRLVALSLIILSSAIYADGDSLSQHLDVLASNDSNESQVEEAWQSLSRDLAAMSLLDPARFGLMEKMDMHFVKRDVLQTDKALMDYLRSRNSSRKLPDNFCYSISHRIQSAINELMRREIKTADAARENDEVMFAEIKPWLYATDLLSNPRPTIPKLIDLFFLSFEKLGIKANKSALLIADTLLTIAKRNSGNESSFFYWLKERIAENKFADALKLFVYFESAAHTRSDDCPTPVSVNQKYLSLLPLKPRPSSEERTNIREFLRIVHTYLSEKDRQTFAGHHIIKIALKRIIDPSADTTLADLAVVQHCVSELVLAGIDLSPDTSLSKRPTLP